MVSYRVVLPYLSSVVSAVNGGWDCTGCVWWVYIRDFANGTVVKSSCARVAWCIVPVCGEFVHRKYRVRRALRCSTRVMRQRDEDRILEHSIIPVQYSAVLGVGISLWYSNNGRQNAEIKTAKPFYRVCLGILVLLCYQELLSHFFFLASSEPFLVPGFLAVGGCSFRTFNLTAGAGGISSSRGVLAKWWGCFVGVEQDLNYYYFINYCYYH